MIYKAGYPNSYLESQTRLEDFNSNSKVEWVSLASVIAFARYGRDQITGSLTAARQSLIRGSFDGLTGKVRIVLQGTYLLADAKQGSFLHHMAPSLCLEQHQCPSSACHAPRLRRQSKGLFNVYHVWGSPKHTIGLHIVCVLPAQTPS